MRIIKSFFVLTLALSLFSCSSKDPEPDPMDDPQVIEQDPVDIEEPLEDDTSEETDTETVTGDVLNPDVAPSSNFDLSTWYLSIPENSGSDKSTSIYEEALNNGYENSKYFYTGEDGGMVFKCPVRGFTTSENTSYVRVELREMLRNGNTDIANKDLANNWVFSSAPQEDIDAAAAYDGEMTATLAVNKVTTTGERNHIGRVIIGQIHANTDEPIRLYYRKLLDNELGSIYFGHEENLGDDTYYEMIGRRSSSADNPEDGIALDEVFTYKIKVIGNDMWVTISREGKDDIVQYVDMSPSGYDVGGQYMYFKAGIYHPNNTGDDDDYAQVTFYKLETSHTTK